VEIVAQGQKSKVESFIHSLETEAPPLARIDSILVRDESLQAEYSTFDIRYSTVIENAYQPVSPDVAICPDCERELFDPQDRRYLYPFINCTNCGPRFTIIKDMPYDRPATTMADFAMCPDCRAEYVNPSDRRFHAQPIACPACGPFVELREAHSRVATRDLHEEGFDFIEHRRGHFGARADVVTNVVDRKRQFDSVNVPEG
jgi:hydrogenase maturation protein HypF